MKIVEKGHSALIGAGRWGKNLARNLYSLGVLHTLCDANESLLHQFQKQYPELKVTSDYSTILENPEITSVFIASPAALHYALAKQALLSGKDVFVEKPLCLDAAEGQELIELAQKQDRILMVGHLLQYHPHVCRLQEMVKAGELGKMQYIVSNRMNLGSFRTEENALWSFAPHDISVILSLCGNRLPEELRCTGGAYLSPNVADTTLTTMKFSGNVRAHIFVNWLNPFKEQKLIVIGSSAMAVFDDTLPWEEKLQVYRNHVKWVDGNVPKENKSEGEKISVPQGEPLRTECEHFLTCCKRVRSPAPMGRKGCECCKFYKQRRRV